MHEGWLERTPVFLPLPQESTTLQPFNPSTLQRINASSVRLRLRRVAFFCGNSPRAAYAGGQRGEEVKKIMVKKILFPFS
jgi:hypothetical protein